ncbi:carbon-monoxide dehydrogenase medium subunit [Pseudonocardia thermophila]|jgi:Aerobic-type carbon monoxide dehydrogenase, middle subunit CoxM/CutM homologs|uniref:Carbon-monoxide dehydrogenase medium subunit n=1 Tax=Pseudonocardia thermophila TaxID=1848 RepID=A0A1M6Q1L3_PSETH|nr:xanthine dehydrogenase family protein subunit M [Pseudonocardia thermophila]SHK14108.1 carbon-monoxide dehydrogenase medium subunit [Pseudonocardia thermophila]
MYPAKFAYEAPRSIQELLDLLARHGDDAKVLAGGQSLVPMLKLRFAAPELVVDINGVPGLDHLTEDPDGTLRVGALCRHVTLERSALLAAEYPVMAAAAPLVADPMVRSRGTMVGSICHADPQGDWASVLMALGGHIVAMGPRGKRPIAMTDFVVGPFQNALQPGEFAYEAVVPPPVGQRTGTYLKLERRVGDFATVGVAVSLEHSGGRVVRAGIALTGVGPATINAADAADVLVGKPLSEETVEQAARLAAEAAQPQADHRGSVEYKRHVVATFVRRGLARGEVVAA